MKKYKKKFYKNSKNLLAYYDHLIKLTRNNRHIGSVNEWVIDNYYLVVERERAVFHLLDSRKAYKNAFSKRIDLYEVLRKILRRNNFKLDTNILISDLNKYQDNFNHAFNYHELNAMSVVAYVVLIDELVAICEKEKKKLEDSYAATDLIKQIEADVKKYHEVNLNDYISLDDDIINRPVYLERLNAGLKELGKISNDVFKQLNEILDRNNVNLNGLLDQVYSNNANDNMIVANIFNTLNKLSRLKIEALYKKVSKTEYVLLMDPYYDQMTIETKAMYRERIMKYSRNKKLEEYEYAKEVIGESTKKEIHVGELLFPKENLKARVAIFVGLMFILTLLISAFLGQFLVRPAFVGFLLLIIPVSEICIQLGTRFWSILYRAMPIPKLNFIDGIPKNSATMTVIPTIVKDVDKLEKMFKTLETYYLANKSNNLYFTLLADCSSSQHQIEPFDEEILENGKRLCEQLNKKYGKDIFHFIYRKRVYNDSEEQWLGYERKRGALEHFNMLLLGKLSDEDQEVYYKGHTFDGFDKKIKYVITLDQDTNLILGAAARLVGAMSHPLNKPIYNKAGTAVVSGYGIMQPRVAVDVESTNKSMFTQIYAGIGGYDVYNKVIPNFYQDAFKEASFWGKGIYDLEAFDQTLTGRFPRNLILSHDLIESNFLRCGYLSDIEIIDDFPSSFLSDATRRHRWARGDMQIVSYIKPKKAPISLLGRYKILDNLRRGLLDLSLLVIIFVALIFGQNSPSWWILFALGTQLLPIIFYIKEKLKFQKERTLKFKHYVNIMYGFKATCLRTLSAFSAIPFNAKLYLDAFVRSIYRMKVSKKGLLAWITAEDAAKMSKNNFWAYTKNFGINYVVAILLFGLVFVFRTEYMLLTGVIAILFMSSGLMFYLFSQDLELHPKEKLSKKEEEEIKRLAKTTWKFFEDFMTEENNYLIMDNYQVNREIKEDVKTSPTNIGLSMMACISAYELEFITLEQSINKLKGVIETIERLEKWNGHLYNWYNVKTLDRMHPPFISTVDSGNIAASLFVVQEFLKQNNEENLHNRVDNLIKQMNFRHLYNKAEGVFSIGYNVFEEKLETYNYNKFASESRLASYIAIVKGDIKNEHWFAMDKTLTTLDRKKGLLSWSGTSFEYFMPLVWMKTYPNTLLDESYYFAHYCQKKYMNEIDPHLPWGISESAYNLLDDSLNYKYKAFGTPYLKLKEATEERVVISPYSSVLAMIKFPKDVYNNLQKYKSLEMYGEYGLYESYDCEDDIPIYAYFSHHQGMIFCSLANYLTSNSLQEYFHSDVRVQSFDVLTKEKVQIEPMIDLKIVKYKKYSYEKESFENDIREYNYISARPEISILSNSRYSLLLNDRGAGFSRFKTTNMNRHRRITEQEYGNFLYIRDMDSNKIWSNTYAPTNVRPERYHVVFATDRIKYMRSDNDIITTTEVIVTKRHNAEIRKISFRNLSSKTKKLELTTYTEPIICEKNADISHRVFNSMFIRSFFDEETNSLIMDRRMRESKEKNFYISKLLIDEPMTEYSYETERGEFVCRGTNYQEPSGLFKKLSNYTGDNIDPISSIRNRIEIGAGKEVTVYMINGFGKSEEQVLSIVNSYVCEDTVEEAFELSTMMVNANAKKLHVKSADVNLYNMMLNYLYQTSRINLSDERKKYLNQNEKGQDTLWSFGISGEKPIVLVEIHDISSLNLAIELLKAFEYYKSRCIFVDLVIINAYDEKSSKIIRKAFEDEVYRMYAVNNFSNTPGRAILLEKKDVNKEELNLFRSIARLALNSSYNQSLREYIDRLQTENQINDYEETEELVSDGIFDDTKLEFENTYGGFTEDGSEYHITNPDTPMPWANVLTNGKFGSIVTNNDNGFTYATNSREFKITSWTNDTILDDKSEGITINNKGVKWHDCVHGIGYSKFKFKNEDYRIDATYFVPSDENVKIALYTIRNISAKDQSLDISYWINPVMGVTEEKTSRHLICNFYELNNFLTIQNKYAMNFKDHIAFVTSTEEIHDAEINKVVTKEVFIKQEIKKRESVTFAFVLGCDTKLDNINKLVSKYNDLGYIETKYKETMDYWKTKLGMIQVSTPDKSFDYMMNNWLLYQSYASRIMARAGFYQVGGAFGYRDQLQDSMNICVIDPEAARKQIFNCAKHQFKEGDVLHWWHIDNQFGLRSRYKDDYLWLIYATTEYIRITGDLTILDEQIPFVQGDLLRADEEERGMEFTYSEDTASLYEHLELIMRTFMDNIGDNGIPLMGGGDWNDGMNLVGIHGKGTSVWLGFFGYEVTNRFIEITKRYTKNDTKIYATLTDDLKNALWNEAWDGEYYLRAFFDNGDKLGSHENEECKIDLLSQSWAILTDIAKEDQIESIINSIDEHLWCNENNIIKLLTPPFAKSPNNPGYIKNYAKGIRENGGQYTHSVSWYIMALLKLGMYDKAYKCYSMVNPVNRTSAPEGVEKYKTEPYVVAADIYSSEQFPGRGGWTWYTGSSAWFYRVGLVSILGFNKVGEKLYIMPGIPTKWTTYKITYKYKTSTYIINVNNNKDKYEIRHDGVVVNEIELIDDGKTHNINVNIEKEG